MKDCKHFNFNASVAVARIQENENSDVIKNYMAGVKVNCADCGLPFEFIGLEGGVAFHVPRVSWDRTEANMPIVPSTDPVEQIKAMQ